MRESGTTLEEAYGRWIDVSDRSNLKNELIGSLRGDDEFADIHLEVVNQLFDVFSRRQQLASTSKPGPTLDRKRRFTDSDGVQSDIKRRKVAASSFVESGSEAFLLKKQLVGSKSLLYAFLIW